jgi:predicted molibdopterin-dependent oxidoreductase YjgC
MTRRTENNTIVFEDVLDINPLDAEAKGIQTGDSVRLFSARGEAILKARHSDEVKAGVLYTTFHFPELMVNRIGSDEADSVTLCPEYKVTAVNFEKVFEEN